MKRCRWRKSKQSEEEPLEENWIGGAGGKLDWRKEKSVDAGTMETIWTSDDFEVTSYHIISHHITSYR